MPHVIGRYEIIREIGRGGMATVYLAVDPRIKREVAIKVLPRQFTHDPRFLERFEQEARMIATLQDPAIVPIYDFGEYEDAPYIVMRYMAGGTLWERIRIGPLDMAEIVQILVQLAPALDEAHRRGIIHRDLKPDNVLFDGSGRSYLADFGVARMAEATHTMTVVGTPAYMSPEQAQGKQKLDWRSDNYALSVMLFEMLTGQQPYVAETPTGQMLMHILEPVPDVLTANPELPPQTQAVIDKGMAKDREERYQSAGELLEAVHYLQSLIAATQLPGAEAGPSYFDSETPVAMDVHAEESVEIQGWLEKFPTIPLEGMIGFAGQEPALNENIPEFVNVAPALEGTRKREQLVIWAWRTGAVIVLLLMVLGIRMIFARLDGEALDPALPPPDPVLGGTWRRPKDNSQMVYVPAGSFPMGSANGDSDEVPVHNVVLEAFWIDEKEVTNSQYAVCVSAGECEASRFTDDSTYSRADHPVVGVSWQDADNYCRWAGGHLPTEAQWEYAARGLEGDTYPWGEGEPTCDLAQYSDCEGRTLPVGSFLKGASWVSALDMAGNVWEWTRDWYDNDYYVDSLLKNPEGPVSGTHKVMRGGGWYYSPFYLRGASRSYNVPGRKDNYVGFRCAFSDD